MTPWQKHVESWSSCQRCDLCHGRDKVCLARGSLPCDVLFVGEAPGDSEDTLGRPFVGPAGKKLDAMIAQALNQCGESCDSGGQNPDGSWIDVWRPAELRLAFTNLVGCFPKEQKRDGNGEPEPEHIQVCAPRLDQLVRMAKPKLIVCVGGLAESWIMGTKGGKRHLLPWYDGKLVAVTHPAHILRSNSAHQSLMVKRVVMNLVDAFEGLRDA